MFSRRATSIILSLVMIFSAFSDFSCVSAEEMQANTEVYIESEQLKFDESEDFDESGENFSEEELPGESENEVSLMSSISFAGGSGTQDDPYQVSTPEQLNEVRNNLNKYFIQINDIDMSEVTSEGGAYWNGGKGWTPIGQNNKNYYSGMYDGRNYTISGLFIKGNQGYPSLFGYSKGTIKNLIVNADMVINDKADCAIIVGCNYGSITNCVTYGDIKVNFESGSVGGVAGTSFKGIENCVNHANISIDGLSGSVGGVVGDNRSAITGCYNYGKIIGGEKTGGVVGNNCSDMTECGNFGNVISVTTSINQCSYGGVIGYSAGGNVSKAFNYGNVTATITALTENKGDGIGVGGIVGTAKGITVRHSYNMGIISSLSKCGGIVGCGVALSGTGWNAGGSVSINPTSRNLSIVGVYDACKSDTNTLYGYDCSGSHWSDDGIGFNLNNVINVSISKSYTINDESTKGVTKLTDVQLKQKESFTDFDFDTVWDIVDDINYGCPYLRNMPNIKHTHTWGDWIITKDPSQIETGTAERICADDSSHIESIVLPVLTDSAVWTKGEYNAPNCKTEGRQIYTSIYGDVAVTIPVNDNHAWSEWNITKEPTQSETGTAERICDNDNSHKDIATLPTLSDTTTWTKGKYVAPTCEGTGSQEYISALYGTVVETLPAIGHAWGEWNITKEPTQTETGTAERVCDNDNSHKDIATLPILTDTLVWSKGKYIAPTCEGMGTQEYISALYGTVVETLPAIGHAWGEWNITKEPTQTETGTAERICGNDNSHKDIATLPALTDTTAWTKGKYTAPTCEGTGSQEYISALYGTVVETLPAIGHAWSEWNITKEPTQSETGTAERICDNDNSHKDFSILPILIDTTTWTKGKYIAPTCEGTGSQEYISALYGTVIETLPATGHSWGEWNITKEPTQSETGTAERICDNDNSHKDIATLPALTDTTAWTKGKYVAPTCEGTGSQEYISTLYGTVVETLPAIGHAWGEWNITKEPTQSETGTAERICGNDNLHKDIATLPILTDTLVWAKGKYVAPTCEGTGSQEYISALYGTVVETLPAIGHEWGEWNITKEPTQTETGTAERICGNDNSHKDIATLPALTDTTAWTKGKYIAPTCEGMGTQEYISALYGTVVETLPAIGHAWGEWNITKEPTQSETGTAERICGNDNSHKDIATLPILTDTSAWTKGKYTAPTCEGTGTQEYVSALYGTVVETLPATGHSWGEWNITKEPTQTETGTAERICDNDNSHKDFAILPTLTDTTAWTKGKYIAPTCEGTGTQEYISVLYGTVVETLPAIGHAWSEWNITKEPTQSETGTAERICDNDNSHKDFSILPTLTDTTTWTKGKYIAPNCEGTGSQEYISTLYGTVIETLPAIGHAWGEWNITKEPTQSETGTAERICGNDSTHKDIATLPTLTDTSAWTKGKYVAPTCEGTGTQEYISVLYGTVIETLPATGHSWGEWNITKEPTQSETGTAERICDNDNSHKDFAILPILIDTTTWTKGKYTAPTCEGTGTQEYISVLYGTVIEILPATGHSWSEWNITKEPTQSETGTAERICDNDNLHKDIATLPTLTDTSAWAKGKYIAPTCEGTGSQEYVSALYGTVVETLPATGHSWGEWNITKEPTQSETGTAERICDNDNLHKDIATLPTLTDTSAWAKGKYIAPTCEGTGSQEYVSALYGTVVETLPATGHSWGEWNITKEPTQTETGTAERVCDNDNSHKDIATLPILTDTSAWTKGKYTAPTCEGTGTQEYISALYGTVIETLPAIGHTWGEWDITKEPTQTETGTAERICDNDNLHKDIATLPILTDTLVWAKGKYVAPTCEGTGTQEYISALYGTVVETLPAIGHAWGEWNITKEPTQSETGTAERICDNDNLHKDIATLPTLTDTSAWTKGKYVAPTCEGTGSQEYISVLYGTVIETLPATGHKFNILQHDETKHWYKCERCVAISGEENHTGGQATKTEKPICSVCNVSYGKMLPSYDLPSNLNTKYGNTLSEISLPTGWKWSDPSIVPTVVNDGYEAYYNIVNDVDYDWTGENGYDDSAKQIRLIFAVNVEKANQDISYAAEVVNKYTTDSAFSNELTKIVVHGDLDFSSSDESVATVDNSGTVTIKGAGTTVITATVAETDNYNSASASYTLNVTRYSNSGGGGGSSASYVINFETNGGTIIDSVRVKRNELLKKPTNPARDGYEFVGWYGDEGLTDRYDFAKKVTRSFTLYAKWDKNNSGSTHPDADEWNNPFRDVFKNDWFYESVKYVYVNGIMNGVEQDLFAPNGNITRAMFATVIYRAESEPAVICDKSFDDVETGSYYEKAVYWAKTNGIVKGITNELFAPDDNISREQMAAMIYRYAMYKKMYDEKSLINYNDSADISDWAQDAVAYCTGGGIMQGKGDNIFAPHDGATRAETTAILQRVTKKTGR